LSVETHFNFYNLVLAPDTLYTENIEDGKAVSYATRIRTSNDNDTGTIYVRAKFTTNRPELTLHFNKFTDATTYNDDLEGYWCYNSSDQYYYYLGEVGSTDIIFNSGYYVDNTLNNSKANADVEINFVFESIQRPYGAYHAVWKSAPGIFDSFASSNSGYVESTP